MRKVAIILIALCFVATLVIYGEAFAQKDANDSHKSVEALKTTEASVVDSSPVPAPETGLGEEVADEVDVDEDA